MISRESFMKIAEVLSESSKCVGAHVGAVIVKDGRILSSGYNGTPIGYHNCNEVWDEASHPDHYEWSQIYEIHAEQNAIIWAAKEGIAIKDADIYSTMRPCHQCTKLIIGSGIKNIYYNRNYSKESHLLDESEMFIRDSGVNIEWVDV